MSLIIDNRWQNFHLSIYFREIFPKEIHIRRCNASDLPISAMAFKTVMSTVIVAYVKKVRKKESMMFVTDFSRNTISQDVVQLNDKRLVLLVLKNCALVSSSFFLSGRRKLFSRILSEGNKLAWRLIKFLIQNLIIQSFVRRLRTRSEPLLSMVTLCKPVGVSSR